MDNKKRNIIIAISVSIVIVALAVIAGIRIFGGFKPERYVNAVLSQTMKGEVGAVTRMTKGLSADEAQVQYEIVVTSFMNNVILSEVSLSDEQKADCLETCKKIFRDMKYEVKSSKKVGDGAYRVSVEIQSADVLQKMKTLLSAETDRIYAKMEAAEYQGTLEEIEQQMKKEYADSVPAILKTAYETMEYKEAETIVLNVKKGENGLYGIDSAELNDFIVKILGLTTNQD